MFIRKNNITSHHHSSVHQKTQTETCMLPKNIKNLKPLLLVIYKHHSPIPNNMMHQKALKLKPAYCIKTLKILKTPPPGNL
jgi:hypothetical protein